MRGELKREGDYELFKTTEEHQILNIGNDFFALVKGQEGDVIVQSDSDHEKDKEISTGKFFYADFEDDPEFQDMPHMFLEDKDHYRELILPNGLPGSNDYQKKLIRSDEKISKDKVQEHVKGKGYKGSEKKYSGEPEKLRSKTKNELYDLAQKYEVEGRSKMDKEELINHLADKID